MHGQCLATASCLCLFIVMKLSGQNFKYSSLFNSEAQRTDERAAQHVPGPFYLLWTSSWGRSGVGDGLIEWIECGVGCFFPTHTYLPSCLLAHGQDSISNANKRESIAYDRCVLPPELDTVGTLMPFKHLPRATEAPASLSLQVTAL